MKKYKPAKTSKDSIAQRALCEARERKAKSPQKPAKEIGGRKGLEPTRYGDWEHKGIAHDF